jgi:hypothetical protein
VIEKVEKSKKEKEMQKRDKFYRFGRQRQEIKIRWAVPSHHK